MSPRRRILSIFAVTIAALLLLASGLDSLNLKPGQEFHLPSTEQITGSKGVAINLDFLPTVIQAIVIILSILLPFFIIYMLIDPQRRKRLLADLVGFLFFIGMLSLMHQFISKGEPQNVPPNPLPAALPNAYPRPGETPAVFDAAPGDNTVTLIAFALGGVAVAGAAFAFWFLSKRRHPELTAVIQLAAQAEETIEELLAGKDLRTAILLCYRRMTEIAAKKRNLPRDVSVTPHEFEQAMVAKGLPSAPVHDLTRLFEDIRYGAQDAGEEERLRAVSALRIIAASCRAPENPA